MRLFFISIFSTCFSNFCALKSSSAVENQILYKPKKVVMLSDEKFPPIRLFFKIVISCKSSSLKSKKNHSRDLQQQVIITFRDVEKESFVKNPFFFFSFLQANIMRDYSTANPQVSSTAWVSLSVIFSLDSYDGRSNRLKQVWAFGKLSVQASIKCKVKSLGPAAPVEPCKALKPCKGTLNENWEI